MFELRESSVQPEGLCPTTHSQERSLKGADEGEPSERLKTVQMLNEGGQNRGATK